MKRIITTLTAMLFTAIGYTTIIGAEGATPDSKGNFPNTKSNFLKDVYPGLSSGCLMYAHSSSLPEKVLLQTKHHTIRESDLHQEIDKAPPELREKLRKNSFYLLEQMVTRKLLLQLAQSHVSNAKLDKSPSSESELIDAFLLSITNTVKVTDKEVADFYQKNRDMCGGATLSQVQEVLKTVVLQEKQKKKVQEYIQTLGQQMRIEISSPWCAVQFKQMRDNPVDRARWNGRPSLVDFGSVGCRPCDMMAPILETLKEKYQGKLDVLFIHVGQEPILAGRYGVQSIPIQIFFDKKGNEVFRHIGFLPQVEIEKKLQEMGVK